MTTIGTIRRVAALGLMVTTGASLISESRGQVAYTPQVGTILNGAALQATPVVSADRRYVRMTLNPYFNTVNGFTTYSAPLGAVGGGGFGGGGFGGGGFGGGAAGGGGFAGMNGPIAGDGGMALAQGTPSIGTSPAIPRVGVAPVIPNGSMISPVAPDPFVGLGPGYHLNNRNGVVNIPPFEFYGLNGIGPFGPFGGVGGFGPIGGYGGFGGYNGFGDTGALGYGNLSLPPTPENSFGVYRAGNNLGADAGTGGPVDPNARPAQAGAASDDPFDTPGVNAPRRARSAHSRRTRHPAHRPTPQKSTRRPSAKVEPAPAEKPEPEDAQVKADRPVEPTEKEKPAEKPQPTPRRRSMLGSPR